MLLSADIDVSKVVELLKREYNRRADFSPLLWSKGMKLQLKEVYTSLRVVSGRKGGTLEIDVGDIFGSSEEDKDPLVLVEGSPGIGKTTFCLKLAHDWANGAMPSNFPIFKLVFLLKCRDMKGDIVEDVVEEIFEQLLPEDLKKKTKEAFVNFLEDVDNQKQILIIFDGLDELPKKSEDRVYKVLDRKKLSSCYVLATTRQEKGIYTWAEYKIGICLAIEGFSEENSFEYIRKHFRNIGTEHASKGERLIQEVKRNPLLGHLQTNPLNLLLLCVVYQDHEGSLPSSITDLYQIIVRCLFRRYCAKEELKASVKDEDVDKQFEIAILALGGLAWECLLNGHLSFYEDELEELERSNENVVARRLGLVYKEESVKKLKPRHTYSFLHKTFQEYLAASYIAYNLRGSQVFVLKQVRFSLASPKFRQVCLFVCGILREEASILFTQIGDALQEHWDWSKCIRETASFFNEILKESGNAERVANTFCSFLPFPWVLHVSKYDYKELINVLEACAGFSKVQTPAELHVTIPPGLEVHENIQRVLARVPNVKTLILPAVRYSIDRAEVGKVLRASKTLKNVTFALSAGHGEDWASALDVGLGADSSLSSVDLRIHGILNQSALRAVENLLFNKCLSSLSITMCGDAQESLAEVLARSLVGESAVEFLDLCVNGKLSLDGAYSLEDGILSNKSLRNVNLSVYGELPANWQAVEENLHAKLAEKGVLSAIYPSTFSRVKGIDVIRLHRFVKTYYVQQNVTLNVWGELSGVDSKAVFKVILHTPVSHLTLNIRGQLTDEILRCTARGVKEKEKLSSVTINTWVQMTEKESNLIKELGLDNNPSVSLNVCGTSVSFKESSDRKVLSSDESQCLVPFLEKESTSRGYVLGEAFAKRTSMNSLTQVINTYDNGRTLFAGWGYELGEGLARGISLNSLTLALNNYSGTGDFSLRKLGEYLAKITSLNSLTLAFSNYDGSSSLSMHDFGKDLAKITSLNSLTLAFNIYKDTSTFCMDDLGKNLAKLTFLNSLTLAFINYVGSSWFFVDDFGEGWAKSTSLSSHWHLTTTVTVTESGMTMFSKVWKRASL